MDITMIIAIIAIVFVILITQLIETSSKPISKPMAQAEKITEIVITVSNIIKGKKETEELIEKFFITIFFFIVLLLYSFFLNLRNYPYLLFPLPLSTTQ